MFNVGKTIINHPFGNGLSHLFIVCPNNHDPCCFHSLFEQHMLPRRMGCLLAKFM